MPLSENSNRIRKENLEKISQVIANITAKESSNFKEQKSDKASSNGKTSLILEDKPTFTKSLFNRAPADFLSKASTTLMQTITDEAFNFLNKFIKSEKDILIEFNSKPSLEERKNTNTILIALGDRPYIIDTITEQLNRHKLKHKVLLHPILQKINKQRVSLSYIEISQSDDKDKIETFKSDLEAALNDVIDVTNDFSSIVIKAEGLSRAINLNSTQSEELEEISSLVRWFIDGAFVLLGYNEWTVKHSSSSFKIEKAKSSGDSSLGLFKSKNKRLANSFGAIDKTIENFVSLDQLFSYSKANLESTIHRLNLTNLLLVKELGVDGKVVKVYALLGLLTPQASLTPSSKIPVARKKIKDLVEKEGLIPSSHDYKEIISISNILPRILLLQNNTETIRNDISLILDIQRRDEIRTRIHVDPFRSFISVLVIMPIERYGKNIRNQIKKYLEKILAIKPESTENNITVNENNLALLHFLAPLNPSNKIEIDEKEIEAFVTEITLTWEQQLEKNLIEIYELQDGQRLFKTYESKFSESYKATSTPLIACADIAKLELINESNPIEATLEKKTEQKYNLRLYKLGQRLALSDILPYLENCGFRVISETCLELSSKKETWAVVYDIDVELKSSETISSEIQNEVIPSALKEILNEKAENDELNALVVRAGLSIRDVQLLRTIVHYISQTKIAYSTRVCFNAIIENEKLAKLLVLYFYTKFDPKQFSSEEERSQKVKSLNRLLKTELKKVNTLVHDRTIQAVINVIDAIVRTNFFIDQSTYRVSFKIRCELVNNLPKPVPLFEIFVNDREFSGTHLRAGKVARGGLRWSERPEDFRTEVLGLVKTQVVKNAIIIPTGAKGGFVLKQPSNNREDLKLQVETAYRKFIYSLLEITDNRKENDIVRPNNVICYDDVDPYLVVAADKGTATFSDIANEIATKQFSFWLGDAFASGGSNGYDHKKYGITARGAWECVTRHFRELGIEETKDKFSLIGIGDMSGDVFGNGLLLSKNARLIAAFNHRHIFIDPSPDCEKSFNERKRLFETPGSAWSDYSPKLISKGGGVFERSAKEIKISKEAKSALSIESESDSFAPDELIKNILLAPVDLIWNGGIGTYVKSKEESNSDVGDRANDELRVDAKDLRAKVIGEGGNLGFTQLGRIEYAKIGGRINLDAVDNSGGVEMSDREVNLKILLNIPIQEKRINEEKRNTFLSEIALDVSDRVTNRNKAQGTIIGLEVARSRLDLKRYANLIDYLETSVKLDRVTENLPSDEEIEKRLAMKAGLTRPEIAVVLSYTKMDISNSILNSNIPEDLSIAKYLNDYFPSKVVENFENDILNHPLKREIVATQVADVIVERVGPTFIHSLVRDSGVSKVEAISAFIAADIIFDGSKIAKSLLCLDTANSIQVHNEFLTLIGNTIKSATRWMIHNEYVGGGIQPLIDTYKEKIQTLGKDYITIKDVSEDIYKTLKTNICPETLHSVINLPNTLGQLDIVKIAAETNLETMEVELLYNNISKEICANELIESAQKMHSEDQWIKLLIRKAVLDIRKSVNRITKAIILENKDINNPSSVLSNYIKDRNDLFSNYKEKRLEFQSHIPSLQNLINIQNSLRGLYKSKSITESI